MKSIKSLLSLLLSVLIVQPFFVLIFASKPAFIVVAQTTTGTLVGTVVDEQNNPITDAEIVVVNS